MKRIRKVAMAVYKCSVMDHTGKRRKINSIADSRSEVIEYLKQSNYIIIDVKKTKSFLKLNMIKYPKIKSKDLSVFCRQIYTMLKAGVTIVNSLEILKQQTENKNFAKIIGQMYKDLQKGNTFSEVLQNQNNVFPAIFINMVEAGESSGNIDVIMNRLSNHFEKEYKIENKVKSAMAYPLLLAIICIAVVIFMLTTIMPTFVGIYSSSGVELPKITQVMIAMSEALKNYWYIFVLGIAAMILAVSAISKNENVNLKKDYYKLKIPLVKNLAIKVAASRFTRTLSTLMGSGVHLLQALETVSGVTGNTYIGSKIMEARDDVKRGLALSQHLRQQEIFPPMVHYMIKVGEDSGFIEEILDKTADFYDEEVDTAVTQLTTIIEPIMIVLMAIIIGFIVIAMITPMFDMIKTVQ